MNKGEIAVLIPCYNESATIVQVIQAYRQALPEACIYVYDNNSTDGTDTLAREAGAVVRYETRQGKGNVIRTMFREVDADAYLMVDGDATYPADDAKTMVDSILSGKADMVIGDRLSATYFQENKRPFHNFGNCMVRHCINTLWRRTEQNAIQDVMTGYRAFSPLFVKSFPILSKGFEIETEMTIHALDKNFRLESLPVSYKDRPAGSESKLNTYTDGAKVLWTIFTLYRDYQPMRFFTFFSVILAAVSLLLFLPVLYEYMTTGLVPRMPTLITSGFLFLSAMQSITCGIILETETKKARQQFELHLTLLHMQMKNGVNCQ